MYKSIGKWGFFLHIFDPFQVFWTAMSYISEFSSTEKEIKIFFHLITSFDILFGQICMHIQYTKR